jgi:hypothetical protein
MKKQVSMYEVDLHANPEHLLDWDRPINQQTPFVKETISSHPMADRLPW